MIKMIKQSIPCFWYSTLRYAALRYAALRYAALRYAALRCATLRYTTLCYATVQNDQNNRFPVSVLYATLLDASLRYAT
jgi:uncharacterized protein YjbI with pentapeptide repeats